MKHKKKDKILGIFDRRPLIWIHYLFLSGGVFLIHWISNITNLESWAVNSGWVGYTVLILYYALTIGIFDQLVHKFLGVD